MKKSRDEVIVEDMINKMFKIAKHDVKFDDIKDRKDNWYQHWTMTNDQNSEWREWGIQYLRKNKRLVAHHAKTSMAWFDLMYGLTIKDA